MKMIVAIVNSDDSGKLNRALTESGFSVTKLATTGGFLHAGNTTFLIGIDDDKVEQVMTIIRDTSKTHKQIASSVAPFGGSIPIPIEIEVGGATVFVLNVEQFERM